MATGYDPITIDLLDARVAVSNDDGLTSPWRYVGNLVACSLVISGLEAGGVCAVSVSNNPRYTFPAIDDPGVPHPSLETVENNVASPLGAVYNFVRVRKTTVGGTPTATTARLIGQVPK